jgi:DNA-binding NarL/FixJ family response regulator
MSYRAFLADNQSVFRAGLARILAINDDIRIVGQCAELASLEKALDTNSSTVFLSSTSVTADAASLVRKAAAKGNRLIAVLEITESPILYEQAGVPGILFRDVDNAALVKCVRTVAQGGRYAQTRAKGTSRSLETDLAGQRVRHRLTPKELKIIGLLVQGYKNRDIAEELQNSEQVIKNCLRSIFDKTGASDRLELALFTMHHRILFDAADQALKAKPQVSQAYVA